MDNKHAFVSISVVPVDVHLTDEGILRVTDSPERRGDHSPEQFCQLCFVPLDPHSFGTPCPGPKVPNDLSSILSH